ncbi:MAG: alpha/beta hydrolase [Nevskia sp.]|nr:alpha/beta hydrolase [Nevskia sp.]
MNAPAPWIFLRGLTRDSHHWGGFPQLFAERVPGAQVIALDLPGNGPLNRLPSPLRVQDMAGYCRDELRRRGLAPPYNVLAMSLGAMAAVAWASLHAEELSACVLINTSLRPFSPFHHRLRPANYAALLRMAVAGADPRRSEATILRLTSRLQGTADGLLDDWAAWRRRNPVSAVNALRQILAAARYRAPRSAPVPTLVLNSARDGLVDPRCSQRLAQAWGCPIRIHPQAGHDLPLDDGEWVAQSVRDWLRAGA